MSQFELTLAWIWIWVSSFLALYISNRYIEKMNIHNDNGLKIPDKVTISNLFKGSSNFTFFFKYRPQSADSKGFISAAQSWRKVQLIYYSQLAILFVICLAYLPQN